MPVYRATGVYYENITGLSWTVTNHLNVANPAAVLTAFNTWNDAYMAICSDNVKVTALRISDVAIYRDMTEYTSASITTPAGTNAIEPTEIGSYIQFKGFGSSVNQGFSTFKLHGIASDKVSGSKVVIADAAVIAFGGASLVYFKQYRPVAGARLTTVVNPPVAFASGIVNPHLYFRRLGRPLVFSGQQRAYRRT